jgi:CheY-like chemotaxis protein
MKIILLEDQGSVLYSLKRTLQRCGHTVFEAPTLLDAASYWKNERIDCIIAALNLNPKGLEEDDIKATNGGVLTGWIWLKKYVLTRNESMKHRIIIYSDYLEHLNRTVKKKELNGIALIKKKGSGSPVKKLLDAVDSVERIGV